MTVFCHTKMNPSSREGAGGCMDQHSLIFLNRFEYLKSVVSINNGLVSPMGNGHVPAVLNRVQQVLQYPPGHFQGVAFLWFRGHDHWHANSPDCSSWPCKGAGGGIKDRSCWLIGSAALICNLVCSLNCCCCLKTSTMEHHINIWCLIGDGVQPLN